MLGKGHEPIEKRVAELDPNSKWFTITVKVLNVGEEKTVFSRRDGNEHRVADALVGDETGTIFLSLWDEDIEKVREKEGSSITIRNGYVSVYKGSMRLSIGRFGQIENAKREVGEVNEKNNISEREVESYRPRKGLGFNKRKYGKRYKRMK